MTEVEDHYPFEEAVHVLISVFSHMVSRFFLNLLGFYDYVLTVRLAALTLISGQACQFSFPEAFHYLLPCQNKHSFEE